MKLKNKMKKAKKIINRFHEERKASYKKLFTRLAALFIMCIICTLIASCNVTRKVTTESSYYQHGDTAVTITVKTIESYDATKKGGLQ